MAFPQDGYLLRLRAISIFVPSKEFILYCYINKQDDNSDVSCVSAFWESAPETENG